MNDFTISRKKQVIDIEAPMVKNTSWERWVFLCGDQHYDSPHCDRKLLKKHFDLALERNAIILSVGDWFDVMCSMRDPRRSKSELRPEYLKSDYLKTVIDDSAKFLGKYAKNIGVMCHGNHETGCIKNSERDITSELVEKLNRDYGSNVMQGEYEEFVRLSFLPPKRPAKQTKYSKMFYMYHGSGGASPVTGGVISNARKAEYVHADFVHMGHTHTSYVDKRVFWEPTTHGTVLEKVQTFIRTGSYKQSRAPGETTWETVKDIKPKPRGGCWLRFHFDTSGDGKLDCDIIS